MAYIRKITKANGTFSYNAEIYIKKEGIIIHRESKVFEKQKEAKDWAKLREAELLKAKNYGITEHLPIKDILARYLKEFKPEGRTKQYELMRLQGQQIAKIDIHKVNARDFIKHIKMRNTECKPQTAANDLVWLGQVIKTMQPMLDYTFDMGVIDSAREVLRREQMIAKSDSRTRRPTKQELWALARHFKGSWMLHVMYFSLYSARRISETTRIEYADIKHENKTCVIRNLKDPRNKNVTAVFKLPIPAYRIIEKYGNKQGRVFPYNGKTVGKYFRDACKVLGIEDLHFHDLRHEATSRLFEKGLSIPEVSQVTLHKNWATLQRYANLKPGDVNI